jgi:hypothetical protein
MYRIVSISHNIRLTVHKLIELHDKCVIILSFLHINVLEGMLCSVIAFVTNALASLKGNSSYI